MPVDEGRKTKDCLSYIASSYPKTKTAVSEMSQKLKVLCCASLMSMALNLTPGTYGRKKELSSKVVLLCTHAHTHNNDK